MLAFRNELTVLDAGALHRSSFLADLHLHPGLNAYYLRRDLGRAHRPPKRWNPLRQQVDLASAEEGGLRVLTACAYAPVIPGFPRPFRAALGSIEALDALCARNPARLQVARRRGEVGKILAAGKLAVLHAAEGGHHLEGSLEKLEALAARGLRYLTLTHFVHNGIAQPAVLPGLIPFRLFRGAPGLTPFGVQVVKKCEELGVLLDLTHCSDRSFADVASLATRPLLATHTGLRRFYPAERNLSDEMLKTIASSGGMVGIISWGKLLSPRKAALEQMIDTLVHAALVAGPEHVGIGTDFDGWVSSASGIREARHYPFITAELAQRGFSESEIRGILGGNYLRVLGEA